MVIIGMAFVLMALGLAIAAAFSPRDAWVGVVIALAVWVVLWLTAVGAGSAIVLASAGAREIQHDDMPRLFNVVEEMSIAASLPALPKVYVIDCAAPNALACGTPEKSAVAVTSGLLMKLGRDELQGVVAHEIGHIKNEDTKFLTLAGVLMGAIVLIADGFVLGMFYGGRGGRRSSSRDGGQAQAIIMLLALLFAILAPLIAQLLYFACSRQREYLADASAARFTRYPEGLASALEKISANADKMSDVNRVAAPMYIVNPLKASAGPGLFSTHPPTEERVRILRSMGGGAGFAQYESAYENVAGGSLLGAHTLSQSDAPALRDRVAAPEEPDLQKVRETVDVLHRMGDFLFLQCACGLEMKIPPAYRKKAIVCPRCHSEHAMPHAVAAATAAGLAAGKESEGKSAVKARARPLTFRATPGKWNSFRCPCGKTLQVSPASQAHTVRCGKCGRETTLLRD